MGTGLTHRGDPTSGGRLPALGRRLPHFINRTLLGYAALVILAGWTFGLWHIWRERGETLSRSNAELSTIAIGIAQHVEAMLHDGMGAARAAVNMIETRGGLDVLTDAQVVSSMKASLTGGNYVRALLLNDGKRDIRATRSGVVAPIEQVALDLPAMDVSREGDIWIGNPVFVPGRPDDMVLPIAVHIVSGVQKPLWIGVLYGITPIHETYERLRFQDGIVSLASADNRLLVRVPAPDNDVRVTGQILRIPPIGATAFGEPRIVRAPSQFTGAAMVYVHYGVNGYPLEVIVGRPEAVIFAAWQSRALNTLGIMGAATLLFILLTAFLRHSIDDLKNREAEYRMLFDNSGVSVFILRGDRLIEANQTAYETFRLSPGELAHGLRPWNLSPERQPDGELSEVRGWQNMARVEVEGQVTFRWMHKRMDSGELFPAQVNLSFLRSGDSSLVLAIVHDLSDIERTRTELAKLNAGLEERVRRRTRDLEQANVQLALANQELESFAAAASHDLRSPLGSISGMAGLLQTEVAEGRDDTAERRLGRIQESVKRMTEIIDGLLSLARMTALEGHVELVDLSELARVIEIELRQQHPERFVTTIFDPDLKVQADPRLMRTMLGNLLGNAWKYTGQTNAPRIEFRCATGRDGTREYTLRDNGVGFDMRYAEKLFKPFRRLHSAEQFPGSGLGLATVARIVRRYGGQIRAESRPGEATTFHFTLPAAEVSASRSAEAASDAA